MSSMHTYDSRTGTAKLTVISTDERAFILIKSTSSDYGMDISIPRDEMIALRDQLTRSLDEN